MRGKASGGALLGLEREEVDVAKMGRALGHGIAFAPART
jgi:hypothetical protein